jgi:hypothetical protein
MSKLTSVTVAIPNMGTVKTFMMMSLLDVLAQTTIPVNISYPIHTYVHVARRDCVLEARRAGSSHIWFVDQDMMWRGNPLKQLASHGKHIVGAHYNERTMPKVSTVKIKKGERFEGELPKHIFQCHAVATGCLLIDMQVFDRIDTPWFFYEHNDEGDIVTGEDMWFCEQAKKAGYGIWCDPSVEIKHLGDFGY